MGWRLRPGGPETSNAGPARVEAFDRANAVESGVSVGVTVTIGVRFALGTQLPLQPVLAPINEQRDSDSAPQPASTVHLSTFFRRAPRMRTIRPRPVPRETGRFAAPLATPLWQSVENRMTAQRPGDQRFRQRWGISRAVSRAGTKRDGCLCDASSSPATNVHVTHRNCFMRPTAVRMPAASCTDVTWPPASGTTRTVSESPSNNGANKR